MNRLIERSLNKVISSIDTIIERVRDKVSNITGKPKRRRYKVAAIRDSKTCKLCRSKDGLLVYVGPEDSVEAIAYRMANNVPPFHINCRCQLVEVGMLGSEL